MSIRYEGAVIFVSDIDVSRRFYEQVLGQEVVADHGPHLVFKAGFFLWQADHAVSVIYGNNKATPERLAQDNFELYFESEDLDDAWDTMVRNAVSPVHETVVHPWGQRGFRVYDPDGYIVEVGEPLPTLIERMAGQGLSAEEISERTTIPVDFIESVLKG